MRINMELKNYRCFPDTNPVRFSISDRFASFVGINNSGKSSLLRFFFEFRDIFAALSQRTDSVTQALRGQPQGHSFRGLADSNEVFNDSNGRDITIHFRLTQEQTASEYAVPKELVLSVGRITQGITLAVGGLDREIDVNSLGWGNEEGQLNDGSGPAFDLLPYFEAFRVLVNSIYIGPFRNAINVGSNENYYDLATGQAFIQNWQRFKSGPVKRDNQAAVELTEDIRRIFDFKSLEINASPEQLTLQVIIDGKPYRLHELGAGISHFIIVLAYVATRRPDYVFIDEPELNLHPTLQMDFLTTLATHTRRGGVMFGTHSLGLARAMSEIVYSVRRVSQGISEVSNYEATPRLAEFLGELSFAGYQELGFDQLLLAEGPNDVTTIQRWLRLYRVEHEILVMPLGGASLINAKAEPQLAELKRITKNISVLIDSERIAEGGELAPDRDAFVTICKNLAIPCHVLERRALENYLPEHAIQRVKGEKYRALGPFEKLAEADPAWSKAENWRIAGEMSLDDLARTDLDDFLSSLVPVRAE